MKYLDQGPATHCSGAACSSNPPCSGSQWPWQKRTNTEINKGYILIFFSIYILLSLYVDFVAWWPWSLSWYYLNSQVFIQNLSTKIYITSTSTVAGSFWKTSTHAIIQRAKKEKYGKKYSCTAFSYTANFTGLNVCHTCCEKLSKKIKPEKPISDSKLDRCKFFFLCVCYGAVIDHWLAVQKPEENGSMHELVTVKDIVINVAWFVVFCGCNNLNKVKLLFFAALYFFLRKSKMDVFIKNSCQHLI